MVHTKAGRPREGAPVKYCAAVLARRDFDLERRLYPLLEERFGRIDFHGEGHPFTVTDYYRDEMGPELRRTIVSFEPLGSAADLAGAKLAASKIEGRLGEAGNRLVNVDIGYMDFFKLVLASFKDGPQKIYLGEGVYADPVLMFHEGAFRPLEWTFPDFKTGTYGADLMAVRALYKAARHRDPGERR